ncbi:uncharacterized protein LOC113003088 [Solenopsis invicta]|uniref:uncharacterized protein LOC113003088 n=1 Tax=Solenopsis invicta TaxID=13686 RepID=UPI00193E250B|nr:uncharacterized protein LOC113003088 [Solenopsis invicta]
MGEEQVHVQVKDNSPSIERILRLISYTAWLLGVGIVHPRKCPKAIKLIIRIIHIALCSCIMIHDIQFYDPFVHFNKHFISLYWYVYYLNRMMCYISAYYYIYHGIRQYNKWTELMDKLKELDRKIRKEISLNDRSIKIIEALAILTTFTFWPLMLITQAVYYKLYSQQIELFPFYYILAQSLINNYVCDVIVYVLYCRFQTINKLIDQLEKLSDVQWIAFKVRRIREMHADICDLVRMVNDIHGLHLLFCSGNCFTMAVVSLYHFFMDPPVDQWLRLIHFLLCIVYTMQFWLICWICTLACEESKKTGKIIHKIILNCKPVNLYKPEASNQSSLEMRSALEDLNSEQNSNCSSSHNSYVVEIFLRQKINQKCITKEVNDFSTQLQQNRVIFTAYDFFEINNASYGWFVGLIVTYLLLIPQLYS